MRVIHRELTAAEEIEYRDWARTVFKPGQEINQLWHPVVVEECEQMIEEEALRRRISDHCLDLVKSADFSGVDVVIESNRDGSTGEYTKRIATVKFYMTETYP